MTRRRRVPPGTKRPKPIVNPRPEFLGMEIGPRRHELVERASRQYHRNPETPMKGVPASINRRTGEPHQRLRECRPRKTA